MRGKLSYANVMATIAVFIALGGGAYALQHRSSQQPNALNTYRVSAKLDEGDSFVTIWKHGAFRLKGACFVPGGDTFTESIAYIGSPRPGVDYSASVSREGTSTSNHSVYANDNGDAGDYGFVANVSAINTFWSPADGTFGATLPAADGKPQQTVTGNVVVLARHHAPGKDCSITGEVAFG
jgi:hypothetical protein